MRDLLPSDEGAVDSCDQRWTRVRVKTPPRSLALSIHGDLVVGRVVTAKSAPELGEFGLLRTGFTQIEEHFSGGA